MKISKIYVYPIKSFRATSLSSAQVSQHGFMYDRRFMIQQVLRDDEGKVTYKNMHVAHYPDMVLFFTSINLAEGQDPSKGTITITYKSPKGEQQSMDLPLLPDTTGLDQIDVNMHKSPTRGYKMHAKYNDWLSSCFGYPVVLLYLGDNTRKVLMSTSGNAAKQPATNTTSASASWLSSITSKASEIVLGGQQENAKKTITFSDCAPFLVVSSTSMRDVHNRLPAGEEMDITKFRPNIIVEGAAEVWEEDYWGAITIKGAEADTTIECVQNCARCQSLNIDYATGKPGTGEAGKILKKLQSNRRVDPGAKYSPIFGRYSFLRVGCEENVIGVGDEVVVSQMNEERSRFGE